MCEKCECDTKHFSSTHCITTADRVPKLPEGYFFRVEKRTHKDHWGHKSNKPLVKLIKRGRWRDSVVNEEFASGWTETSIMYVMIDLASKLKDSQSQDKLVGDYPPKTMITSEIVRRRPNCDGCK